LQAPYFHCECCYIKMLATVALVSSCVAWKGRCCCCYVRAFAFAFGVVADGAHASLAAAAHDERCFGVRLGAWPDEAEAEARPC